MPKRKPVSTKPIPPAPVTDGATVSRDKLVPQDLVSQIERSLMAQERYEDFIERMYKNMGIGDTSDSQPSARMDAIENKLTAEGEAAWNEQLAKFRAERNEPLKHSATVDRALEPDRHQGGVTAKANQGKSAKGWWLWRAWRRVSRT
jgi:hypothetical protein